MATYTYRCTKNHVRDVDQKMTDEPLTACTKEGCEAPAHRIITAAKPIILKGNDWTTHSNREF